MAPRQKQVLLRTSPLERTQMIQEKIRVTGFGSVGKCFPLARVILQKKKKKKNRERKQGKEIWDISETPPPTPSQQEKFTKPLLAYRKFRFQRTTIPCSFSYIASALFYSHLLRDCVI
jgi:hypothetical protein